MLESLQSKIDAISSLTNHVDGDAVPNEQCLQNSTFFSVPHPSDEEYLSDMRTVVTDNEDDVSLLAYSAFAPTLPVLPSIPTLATRETQQKESKRSAKAVSENGLLALNGDFRSSTSVSSQEVQRRPLSFPTDKMHLLSIKMHPHQMPETYLTGDLVDTHGKDSDKKDNSESSESYVDSDDETNPAPTVLQDRRDEASPASHTVVRDRSLYYKPVSSGLKRERNNETNLDISHLTNDTSFFSTNPFDDDVRSVETPVLDRYRLDVDEESPHGIKVVPNRRRRHRAPLATLRETSPLPSPSSLLLYTQSQMAVFPPRIRSISAQEYNSSTRLVHLQTTREQLNGAISSLNDAIAEQSDSSVRRIHLSEEQAYQMLTPKIVRTLCQFQRLTVSQEGPPRWFEVVAERKELHVA